MINVEEEQEFYSVYRKSGKLPIGVVSFSDVDILQSYYNTYALEYMKDLLPSKSLNLFALDNSNGIDVYSYEEAISCILCNWRNIDNHNEKLRSNAFLPFMSLSDTQYYVKCDNYPISECVYVIFEGLSEIEAIIPVSVDSFLSALCLNIQDMIKLDNSRTMRFGKFETTSDYEPDPSYVYKNPPFTWMKASP